MKEYVAEAPFASFISANSERGFFSLYDEVFDMHSFDRIFILAGGPGTGKSTLLRQIAASALAAGVLQEVILCSSDPESLDGVILRRGNHAVGVLDGTPPHGRIPSLPAVCETLINLGDFWDAEHIALFGTEIRALAEQKRIAYATAYAGLRALGALAEGERIPLRDVFLKEKAERRIRHKLAPLRLYGEQKRRLLRAACAAGERVLPFAPEQLKSVLLVGGRVAAAEIYLSLFADIAKELGLAHTLYLSPISPDYPDAVYLPETQTLVIKESLAAYLPMRGRRTVAERFFTSLPTEGRESASVRKGIFREVCAALADAARAHKSIEGYYGAGMDFARLGIFTEQLSEEVLAALG